VTAFTESVVEEAALAWLESIGWRIAHGPDIAPDMPAAERQNYGEVVLAQRLRDALGRLNPVLPAEALEDAFRKLARPEGAVQTRRRLRRGMFVARVEGRSMEPAIPDGALCLFSAPVEGTRQGKTVLEMLEQTIRRYQNRAIEAAQVIEELIQLAKQMREANARGEKLNLSEEELAFYDALETNDSAVKVLGDETPSRASWSRPCETT
jgi:type I site-specific restriction-modification system R (restriction) subunit